MLRVLRASRLPSSLVKTGASHRSPAPVIAHARWHTTTCSPTSSPPGSIEAFPSPGSTLTTPPIHDSVVGGEAVLERPSGGPSPRDRAVERLSFEVFGKGNQHLKNVENLTALPEGLHSFPEVCFIGKPSCGKSSLISCLLHNRRLGRTGKVRGTTRLLQFFNVGDAVLLVDTPGYGGWKGRQVDIPAKERANAFAILFRYLALRKGGNLKRVYWCIEASARSPLSLGPRDEEILAFLQRESIPFTVILTKIDRHWHWYNEQTRKADVVGKDGVPSAAPWRQLLIQQREDALAEREGSYGRNRYPAFPRPGKVPTPAEGVRRNMMEVFHFLGSSDVPIIGVSANRWHPHRSMNLEALQHDIIDCCSRELPNVEDLTYDKLHELSYAPPRAEDIDRVQRTYPIESFVVPQDDRLSLQEMVDRHENAKARLLAQHTKVSLISSKDAKEAFLQDSRQLQAAHEAEAEQRDRLAELPPSVSFAAQVPSAEGQGLLGSVSPPPSLDTTAAPVAASPRRRFAHRAALRESSSTNDWWDTTVPASATELEGEGEEMEGHHEAALVKKKAHTVPAARPPVVVPAPTRVSSTSVSALPFSLDRVAQTVTAINGVRIPRSLIPSVVEDLAIQKEDEVSAFAAKSGAGAYEEMMMMDALHPDAPEAQLFMEANPTAHLTEAAMDHGPRPLTVSAARRRQEKLLAKYVDRERKERSVYMQAEGFMNPWVGQSGGGGLGAVVGLASGQHMPTGRSGALIKGLKRTGFGGKSYSARTLRGKGRATTKTGPWAA